MKRSRGLPLGKGDVEAEFGEFSDKAGDEARALDAVKVVGTEIVEGNGAGEHPVDGGQNGSGDGNDRLARTASCCQSREQSPEIALSFAAGGPGDLDEQGLEPRSAPRLRRGKLLRSLVERRLPALSSLRGHRPAQEIRWAAVGKRAMSTPISAMMTAAAILSTPERKRIGWPE